MIKNINLKSLVLSSALALSSQNALASSPLPCPSNSPIVDKVWAIKTNVKNQIQNRLMLLDTQKYHQVVVITINSLEEYGYSSFSELWADTINKCGIWYRGKNTGVIVWYGKKEQKPYFISTASWVSGYIPDAIATRITSWSKDRCEKSDTSCRIDDITKWLENIINVHFAKKEEVQVIKDEIKQIDEVKANNNIENIFSMLWIWGMAILVIGWWIKLKYSLNKSSKRKELKKKILQLNIQFATAKTQYPDWFIHSHMSYDEKRLVEYIWYSDIKIDAIINSPRENNKINSLLWEIEKNLGIYQINYQDVLNSIGIKKQEVQSKIIEIEWIYKSLESQWFIFKKKKFILPDEWNNPIWTVKNYNDTLFLLINEANDIGNIPALYKNITWLDEKLKSRFTQLSTEYTKVLSKFESIFGKDSSNFSLWTLENTVSNLISLFKQEFFKKNIWVLSSLFDQSKNIFWTIENNISTMNTKISWYEWLPKEIASLEEKVKKFTPSNEYEKNASNYKKESWKRKFDNYNMKSKLILILWAITELKNIYSTKKWLNTASWIISSLNSEISLMNEYVWLWAIVVTLIAQRIAEEAAQRERQRRQIEDDARRAREQAEDDARRSSRSASSASSSSSSSWSSWWGGGWDGWGGWSD